MLEIVVWHWGVRGVQGQVIPASLVCMGDSDGEEPAVSCGCGDDKEVTGEGWKIVLSWLQVSVL